MAEGGGTSMALLFNSISHNSNGNYNTEAEVNMVTKKSPQQISSTATEVFICTAVAHNYLHREVKIFKNKLQFLDGNILRLKD